MSEPAPWLNLCLVILYPTVFLIWYRRNRRLLTPEQRYIYANDTSAGKIKRWQFWISIAVSIAVLVCGSLLESELPLAIFLASGVAFAVPAIFRNHKIARRLRLPTGFVKRELLLGIWTVVSLAGILIWAFF